MQVQHSRIPNSPVMKKKQLLEKKTSFIKKMKYIYDLVSIMYIFTPSGR